MFREKLKTLAAKQSMNEWRIVLQQIHNNYFLLKSLKFQVYREYK